MLARRVALNFLALAGANAAHLLLSLATVPLVLKAAGEGTLGAARALQDALGYLGLLELGLTGALRPLYVQALATGDRGRLLDLNGAALRAFGRIVVATLLIALVASPLVGRMDADGAASPVALAFAFMIGAFGYTALLARPFAVAQEAAQKSHVIACLAVLQSIVLAGASVGFALLDFGVVGQIAAITIGGLTYALITFWSARDMIVESVRAAARRAPAELRQRIWALNWSTFFNDACGRLCLMTDNLMVASFHGAAAVVPFAYTQRLLVVVQSNLQALGNASWAGLSDLIARNETDVFEQRLLELSKLVVAMSGIALVPLAAVNRSFIYLWLGPERYAGDVVTVLAAVNALILPLLSLWGWCFVGTGNVRRLNTMTAGQTVVNLTVSIGSTAWLGVWGPLLGTLAGYASAPLWWIPGEMKRLFGVKRRRLVLACARPAALCLPLAVGFHFLVARLAPLGWVELVGLTVAITIATAAIVGFFAFSREERQRSMRLVKSLAGRA